MRHPTCRISSLLSSLRNKEILDALYDTERLALERDKTTKTKGDRYLALLLVRKDNGIGFDQPYRPSPGTGSQPKEKGKDS